MCSAAQTWMCCSKGTVLRNIRKRLQDILSFWPREWRKPKKNTSNRLSRDRGWASQVAQWKRIHLPAQETWVQSLIQEDPTCYRTSLCTTTTEPVLLSPCSATTELPCRQLLRPACPRTHAPEQEKLPQWEALAPHLESSPCSPQLQKSPHSSKTQHSQKQK